MDKRPLKVFLCHAHSDRDPARALPERTRLTKDGVDAWLDKEKLLPGQGWELEIRKAVREIIDV
ncbi:MAG: toll/interleukin-1 receptor domain-containing protein [Anaerolineales bacterium]|nr:toll/interleukin-1 receptor domain-containing protein [Anaerolineales bacterium]